MLGGTGFVGRCVTAALVAKGYRVRVPTRNRERHRRLLVLPGVELVNADVHDVPTLRRLAHGCAGVVNLIGILHERPRDGRGFQKAHVELVEKAVAACLDEGVERFVQISALKANAEHGPSHYLRSKGAGERVLKKLAGEELPFTILQPSAIFGADDSFTNLFGGLVRLFPVLPLAKPEARFAPVFVGDIAEAVCRCLEDPTTTGMTLQLCGPEIFSLREIVAFIAKTLHRRRWIVGLPDWLARIQAWLLDYVVPGQILSVDSFKSLAVASVCTENGLTTLGIRPTSMRTVLPHYLGLKDHQRALSGFRRHASR